MSFQQPALSSGKKRDCILLENRSEILLLYIDRRASLSQLSTNALERRQKQGSNFLSPPHPATPSKVNQPHSPKISGLMVYLSNALASNTTPITYRNERNTSKRKPPPGPSMGTAGTQQVERDRGACYDKNIFFFLLFRFVSFRLFVRSSFSFVHHGL